MERESIEEEGVDQKGRLHPSSGIARLMADLPEGFVNTWEAADEAVERASEETLRSACRGLLALHIFAQEEDEPVVAMRNVRVGDYVRLHGCVSYVREIWDEAPERSPKRSIGLKVNAHGPDGLQLSYAYDADVHIPLVARERLAG